MGSEVRGSKRPHDCTTAGPQDKVLWMMYYRRYCPSYAWCTNNTYSCSQCWIGLHEQSINVGDL